MSAQETKERRKRFKSEDNKVLAQRSWEIVSQRNPDLLEEVYAADIVWHEPDQDVQGLAEAKQFYCPPSLICT